ncbi:unnamed protein product (mitochondrion) [Plasmodiophora brassicae]|uniref:SHOCT domain-containing protein n=1 Tax=Plasmodiophora brassicae TaxID=37360 RepID=A0A3P3YL14_PLABS|nr:unnamed protein product [Plasmodiophora brassicae]
MYRWNAVRIVEEVLTATLPDIFWSFCQFHIVKFVATHKLRELRRPQEGVTQVVPGAVWKQVYADYRQKFAARRSARRFLKVRLRDTLLERKPGTSNTENVPKRELYAKGRCRKRRSPGLSRHLPPTRQLSRTRRRLSYPRPLALTQIAKSMHDRGRLTEAQIKQTQLANLKELRVAGVISDEEFRQQTRILMGL